ncbi:hypothetical protein D3C79_1025670 [compost metagenome]
MNVDMAKSMDVSMDIRSYIRSVTSRPHMTGMSPGSAANRPLKMQRYRSRRSLEFQIQGKRCTRQVLLRSIDRDDIYAVRDQ